MVSGIEDSPDPLLQFRMFFCAFLGLVSVLLGSTYSIGWQLPALLQHLSATAAFLPVLRARHVPRFVRRFGFNTSMTEKFGRPCNRFCIMFDFSLKVCFFGSTEVSLGD